MVVDLVIQLGLDRLKQGRIDNETVGGIPFTRGSLAHLLRNRFYIGEVAFKGEVLKGEQPAIDTPPRRLIWSCWSTRRARAGLSPRQLLPKIRQHLS
jgi:hypothetical protein